jgi:tetratricopeptide (TPR) repeat protein
MLPPEQSQDELMLAQAIESIRQGKPAQAKEILTRLLRTDQNNATYWVWMSATMETSKERLYCLQMAYRMDPANAAARRGLIMLGALNPEQSPTPFPMNHPRPWQAKIKLADEKPKPTGIRRITGNPVFRLVAILVLGVGLLGGAVYAINTFFLNTPASPDLGTRATPRPTVTPQANPNANLLKGSPSPLPLATLLEGKSTYTPTALYAATPHPAFESYRAAMRAYSQGDWSTLADMMAQVGTAQPGSVDALYFIAESKRMSGQYKDALSYYQDAIAVNSNFAPIYLGRALTKLAQNPRNNVLGDFNTAIQLDPKYTDAYIARAHYYSSRASFSLAKADMQQAVALNPTSPLIQLDLARLLLDADENQAALEAAQKANELDVTLLDSYLVLGIAYQANGQTDQAVTNLDIYTQYSPNNAEAFTVLGEAYFKRGEYDKALKDLNLAIALDNNNSRAYYWRAEIHMAKKEYDQAVTDFKQAIHFDAASFNSGLGYAQALVAVGDNGGDIQNYRNAYIVLNNLEKFANTDKQRAQLYYNRAISLEKIDEMLGAYNDWHALVSLPQNAVDPNVRATAAARMEAIKTSTPLPPTVTGTISPSPTVTRFPTNTPVTSSTPEAPLAPGDSPTPTLTPTTSSPGTATLTPTPTS